MLFGLGAPPIILDTTFKVFRGGATIFGAVCDILVPRQTSALAERDGPTLVRATLTAAALCSIPAAFACIILIFGADKLFHFLLGNAATMPPATTPILIVLLIANLTQMVTHSVLVHNGYFREVARIGMGVVAAMTGVGVYAVARTHRYRAIPRTLCGGLHLRRGCRGGADDPRADPARPSGRGAAGSGAALAAALCPQRAGKARKPLTALHSTGVCLIQRLSRCLASIGIATSSPRQFSAAMNRTA